MTFGAFARVNTVILIILIAIVSLTPDSHDLDPALSLTEWLSRILFKRADLSDKIAHFLAYGALGLFATFGWGRRWRDLMTIFAFAIAYGLLLEILQLAFGARKGDGYDLLANVCGGGVGIMVALAVRSILVRFIQSVAKGPGS